METMKNLRRKLGEIGLDGAIDERDAKDIEDAARLDLAAARAEGYRQGVEDGKSVELLKQADNSLQRAKLCARIERDSRCREDWRIEHMRIHMVNVFAKRRQAFRGARGIARAEIRQRLAEMERGK